MGPKGLVSSLPTFAKLPTFPMDDRFTRDQNTRMKMMKLARKTISDQSRAMYCDGYRVSYASFCKKYVIKYGYELYVNSGEKQK